LLWAVSLHKKQFLTVFLLATTSLRPVGRAQSQIYDVCIEHRQKATKKHYAQGIVLFWTRRTEMQLIKKKI
jgi:hypothetical protein